MLGKLNEPLNLVQNDAPIVEAALELMHSNRSKRSYLGCDDKADETGCNSSLVD